MYNNQFFETNETKDYQYFDELMSDLVPNFSYNATPKYCYCDATGSTDNIIYEYELKFRTYKFDANERVIIKNNKKYDTIVIEAHKLADLLVSHIMNKNYQPKYVNFLEDETGKFAICFDLLKFPERPKKLKYNNIHSKGYDEQEDGWRFLLPIKYATIFFKGRDKNKYVKIQTPQYVQ